MVTTFHKNGYYLFLNSKLVRVFMFFINETPGNQSKHGHLFLGVVGYTWSPFLKSQIFLVLIFFGNQSKHGHLYFR